MSLASKLKERKAAVPLGEGASVAAAGVAGQPTPPTTSSGPLSGLKIPGVGRKRGRSYGVDIDGNVVRVVEVLGDAVVSYGTYQGVTAEDALRKFLVTRPSGEVTVAWAGSNIHVLRLTMPNLPANAMRAGLLDEIDESLPIAAGNAAVAARTFNAADGTKMAAVAAVERDSATDLWEAIGTADVAIVPSPLVYTQDGLYLGVRYNDTQLTLVHGGAVLAARPLAIGGLTAMFDKLGADPAGSAERFATVARGGTRLDPDAAAVVDAYSSSVGEEVRRTVDFWSRQGHTVPSEVFVHGPGIVLPNLSGKLLDAALFARPVALPNISLEAIARTERPTAYLAIQAALLDVDDQPLADLPDPRHSDRARRKQEAMKRGIAIVTAVCVVGAGFLAFTMPIAIATKRNHDSTLRYRSAVREYNKVIPALSLKAEVSAAIKAYNEAVAYEPAWDKLFLAFLDSAPPNTTASISGLTIKRNVGNAEVLVVFSATVVAPSGGAAFEATVSEWIVKLRELGSSNPWPSSWSVSTPTGATSTDVRDAVPGSIVSVSFNVPMPLDKNPVTLVEGEFLSNRKASVTEIGTPNGSAPPAENSTAPAAGAGTPPSTIAGSKP